MPIFEPIGLAYIELAFRISQHIDGYVDAYSGPNYLRDQVLESAAWPTNQLVQAADQLLEQIETSDLPIRRRTYLRKQVVAMATTCRQLAGERFDYREEVRRCFDIEPAMIDEALFEEAIEELDSLLPGQGDVLERTQTWRRQFEISGEQARPLIDVIETELRSRTLALYPLPASEKVDFRLVNNQPWSGYNWYYGNYHSAVDINTDLPVALNSLTTLVAHEAYPGHHTEHCIKERDLYAGRGWAEHSIFLLNTPECVMAEGIANSAVGVLFTPKELVDWQAQTLYPKVGITGDPAQELRINVALKALAGVAGNAALLLHAEGRPANEVVDYLVRYGLTSEERAQHRMRFISAPLWRAYIFSYFYGEQMISRWFERGDRVERFGTLLSEQIYPSLLEQWVIEQANQCYKG
ncbi:hypothetical protein [Herpetosiphon llansteffanensis]|uniref:hypothetical protein n=1 Tax=Herpetosiphon llansteffanensis TaxID=2094568 RepID=UPI000D7D1F4D|nr:hypothetical protein [Herpetosiphon llansteffanensis]